MAVRDLPEGAAGSLVSRPIVKLGISSAQRRGATHSRESFAPPEKGVTSSAVPTEEGGDYSG